MYVEKWTDEVCMWKIGREVCLVMRVGRKVCGEREVESGGLEMRGWCEWVHERRVRVGA